MAHSRSGRTVQPQGRSGRLPLCQIIRSRVAPRELSCCLGRQPAWNFCLRAVHHGVDERHALQTAIQAGRESPQRTRDKDWQMPPDNLRGGWMACAFALCPPRRDRRLRALSSAYGLTRGKIRARSASPGTRPIHPSRQRPSTGYRWNSQAQLGRTRAVLARPSLGSKTWALSSSTLPSTKDAKSAVRASCLGPATEPPRPHFLGSVLRAAWTLPAASIAVCHPFKWILDMDDAGPPSLPSITITRASWTIG